MITRLRFSISLLASLTAACSGTIDVDPSRFTAESGEQIRDAAPVPDLELAILRTGHVQTLEAFVVSGGSWFSESGIAHSAVLVRHPEGDLLFDTGLGSHVDEEFAKMPWWLRGFMAFEKDGTARALLASEGIDPDGLSRIVLSHLHWDHASGIEDFPAVDVWTTPTEYDWAFESADEEPGYIRQQFDADTIRWQYLDFESRPYRSFQKSADVFGDGSVVLVPLPGHTPGSIGMFVNLPSGKRLFFTGDTTWSVEGFRRPAHKFWLSSEIVDHDSDELANTIAQVHALMLREPDLIVVPAHDRAVQEELGFFPDFVD